MSNSPEIRIFSPIALRVMPKLRLAVLALALPALFSGLVPLLALALAGFVILGLWMLAFAIWPDGRSRRRFTRTPKLTTLALLMDGLAFLTAAGLVLGVLIAGSTMAALITLPGLAALGFFAVLRTLHHKLRRTVRHICR
ncbi:hypothetical protein [Streptomyces sp. NPDC015125]|uniref:hypothetical protein n=1 Tax=Streptomyces sp. NPDC015125 TaxID=3364938 RepID=UPI0036FE5362